MHLSPLAQSVQPLAAGLVPPGARLIVATSGGPDSQALLDVLVELRAALSVDVLAAVGIDHGLRPEAGAELERAAALAERLGVRFVRERVVVSPQGNRLAEARRARYAALEGQRIALGATQVAVAHTADDQLETLLFRLLRGGNLAGLVGIPARRGPLVRPLLQTARREILAHLASRAIAFASDPSNSDRRTARARLRHDLVPQLERENPRLVHSVARLARDLASDAALLERLAAERLGQRREPDGSLALAGLGSEPAALVRRMIAAWLTAQGFDATCARVDGVARLALAAESPEPRLALGGQIQRVGQRLVGLPGLDPRRRRRPQLEPAVAPAPAGLSVPGVVATALGSLCARFSDDPTPPANTRLAVAFDAARLHLELRVRPWRPGDRLAPFGLRGHMKVSDLLTNAKVPRALRASWPVLVDGAGEILWLVGLRRAALAPVERETQRVIRIDLAEAGARLAC